MGRKGRAAGGGPGCPKGLRQVPSSCAGCGVRGVVPGRGPWVQVARPCAAPGEPGGGREASGSGCAGRRASRRQRSERSHARSVCSCTAPPPPVVFQSLLSIRQDDKVVCPRTKEVFHFSQAEKVYIM